jgi:hypothetical protein
MATPTKPLRVKYAPPGMAWAEAGAAGAFSAEELQPLPRGVVIR